jgi:ATP-binding cassette subfamily C protein
MFAARGQQHEAVRAALRECRRAFGGVAGLSSVFNLLMLAGPLYMLQIYDRVLSSRSVPTLVALSLFILAAYLFQGFIDIIRSRIVVRIGALFDRRLAHIAHDAVIKLAAVARHLGTGQQPIRDLDQIRSFLNSPGPIAIVDMPWVPVFLLLTFLIHPWLGLVALVGALLMIAVTIMTELTSRAATHASMRDAELRGAMLEADRHNSESALAMGMAQALTRRWVRQNERFIDGVSRSTDKISGYSSVTKILRLCLQSAILGFGAYLVIKQELTAGAMIAASIMMGRALSPIESAVANWRSFTAARQSLQRLSAALSRIVPQRNVTQLPKPERTLEVEELAVAVPGSQTAILGRVHFKLNAGEALAVIGPSGAGKTSLLRTLVGIWPGTRGVVRIDGSALHHWDPQFIGNQIGFVSQTIELFNGTIAENIARMSDTPNAETVLEAAQTAGAHEMIVKLPRGYETKLGEAGMSLSAGQSQRVALARALYGKPFLVALDEPNSNLDSDGEIALHACVRELKKRGAIVVIIAHRQGILAECDKVLALANGAQIAFGPRDEVLRRLRSPVPMPTPAAAGTLKVVTDVGGAA